tara:strand:+ start:134 stop:298 length:165 start_codon:yes stop_codon:yes gene_type:complete
MPLFLKKIIVKLRMAYCDIRGHHGKKWNYEPADHYMGGKKRKKTYNPEDLFNGH